MTGQNFLDQVTSVDVIIPTYNSQEHIRTTLNSVLEQSFKNISVIIVDGGSSDNTVAIIQKYQLVDERIQLIINENDQGPAHSRYVGIEHGVGDFIAFIDSDDLWQLDKLQIQIDFMIKNYADFTYTDYEHIDEHGTVISTTRRGHNANTFKQYLRRRGIANSSVVVRRAIVRDVWSNAISSTYAEDTLWWLLLMRERKVSSLRIPRNLMQYRVLTTARSSNVLQNQISVWFIYRNNLQLGIVSALVNYIAYICDVLCRKIINKLGW